MEFLLLAILIGLIPAAIARNKGKGFGVWWIYGALLFIVALPHAILLKPDQSSIERRLIDEGGKKCPSCAEIVKGDAKICRFCGCDVGSITPRSNLHQDTISKDSARYPKIRLVSFLFLSVGIFIGICLISYSPTDPALNLVSNVPYVKNWGGTIGAYFADILFIVFGISAYLLSLGFIMMSLLQLFGHRIRGRDIICYIVIIAIAPVLMHLHSETVEIRGHLITTGGIYGYFLGNMLVHLLSRAGTYAILTVGLLLCFTLAIVNFIGIHPKHVWQKIAYSKRQ